MVFGTIKDAATDTRDSITDTVSSGTVDIPGTDAYVTADRDRANLLDPVGHIGSRVATATETVDEGADSAEAFVRDTAESAEETATEFATETAGTAEEFRTTVTETQEATTEEVADALAELAGGPGDVSILPIGGPSGEPDEEPEGGVGTGTLVGGAVAVAGAAALATKVIL